METVKTFDPTWEKLHQEKDWGRYPSEEVVRFVMRSFGGQNRGAVRLLDFGCGVGAVSWFLAREGFGVTAFDGSFTAVIKGRRRLTDERLEADWVQSDAAQLPFADETFDGIIDSSVMYGNPTGAIKRMLKECRRILKPQGFLFSTGQFEAGMSGYGTGECLETGTYRNLTEGPLADRGTVHFFERREIEEWWPEAGFSPPVIDRQARTDQGGRFTVAYFVIQARKA